MAPNADAGTPAVERLAWDTDAIGVPVGRVDVEGAGAGAVDAALDAARRAGLGLLYVMGRPAADAAARLDAAGARLVDERTTFVRPVTPADATLPPADAAAAVRRYAAPAPDAALVALARQSGGQSRFRVDPQMPAGVFERIYDTWIARSVSGEIADAVFVAELDGAAAGMVTVGPKNGRGDIGLLAVAERARGRGLGGALVRAALAWTAARGLDTAQVVTQGANAAACRLYLTSGYAVESAVPVRHLWLAE